MKKNIFSYVEFVTGEKNLAAREWKDVVNNVILPRMAGLRESRWCISDLFMNFLAEYAEEISRRDSHIATVLFEIALQRLSDGAVMHPDDPTPWPEPLPKEYWEYSSKWDETHGMTEGCFHFITKAMEYCLENETTKPHALAILFGLMTYLSPAGRIADSYWGLKKFECKAAELFQLSERLAEKYASFKQLYKHYAQPGQWEKHLSWFARNRQKLVWNTFFTDIRAAEKGTMLQRWNQKKRIKKDILRAAPAQA